MIECEHCSQNWNEKHICWCETCDKKICLMCATLHLKNLMSKPHDVFYMIGLTAVNLSDADICGHEFCRHFRREHGENGCNICNARVKESTPENIAENVKCTGYYDDSKVSDEEKFWLQFNKAASFFRKKDANVMEKPHATEYMIETLCQRRYGWPQYKTIHIINELIEDGLLKKTKMIEFDDTASRFEKCIAKIE